MTPATLAFLWHLHQPLYRRRGERSCTLPFVRLHALRSYYDMVRVLEEFPEVRVTVNLTATLIDQIRAYEEGGSDAFLDVAAVPAGELDPDRRVFIAEHFFAASDRMIDDLPRFVELRALRERAHRLRGPEEAWKEFADRDFADLQVLFDLSWFGFKTREDYPLLRDLRRRGRGFTPDDARALHAVESEILRRVLPLYRDAAAAGRVEIATSPYAHPILPLLIDTASALEAMPGAVLPPQFRRPEDAAAQIREGLDRAAAVFGVRPRGVWPSEGSIGGAALAALGECGVEWTASDAHVLVASECATPADPRRVWTAGGGNPPAIVFRDQDLSDRIGFAYAAVEAPRAVEDFLAGVRRAAAGRSDAPLVVVALDGENPWERYPRAGADFLRALYGDLRRASDILMRTVGEAVAERGGGRGVIKKVRAGSWIRADFSTWIGSPEKNRAWELLGRVRDLLDAPLRDQRRPEEARRAAWEALRAAEASDWFWWLDAGHPSPYRPRFDEAFRGHLRDACAALGIAPPAALDWPIPAPAAPGEAAGAPAAGVWLDPAINGYEDSYFEWDGALVLPAGPSGPASMARGRRLVCAARAAFTRGGDLVLRLDPDSDAGPGVFRGAGLDLWVRSGGEERHLEIDLDRNGDFAGARVAAGGGAAVPGGAQPAPAGVRAAARKILEAAIPLAAAGLLPGRSAGLRVRLRLPDGGVPLAEAALRVPGLPGGAA